MATNARYRKVQEGRGNYEVEVSFEGDEGLLDLYKGCQKNPGHLNFVPVKEFKMHHLPPEYQDSDILDLVGALSDLTVCLAVKRTSQNRPKTFPNSEEPYPCYDLWGRDVLRTGTGWVQGVWKYTNKRCWCRDCKHSANPRTEWGYIVVDSATHLIFDDEESKNTKLHLFYDSDEDRESIYTLAEAQNGLFEVSEDRCVLTFPTHDTALLDKLEALCEHRYQLQRKLRDRYVYPDRLRSYRRRQAVALCKMGVFLLATTILCLIMMNQDIMNMSMTTAADLIVVITTLIAVPMMVPLLSHIYVQMAYIFFYHAYYKPREITNLLKYVVKCSYVILMVIVSAGRAWPILEIIHTPMYYSLTMIPFIIMLTFLDGGFSTVLSRLSVGFSIVAVMIYLHLKHIIRFPPRILTSLWKRFSKLRKMMPIKNVTEQPPTRHKLAIVVSHPHGCCKQVTLGEWAFRESKRFSYYSKYSYTASTCPGSSGALVYILGDTAGPLWMYCNHAHSRRCAEDGLNMCGYGFDD